MKKLLIAILSIIMLASFSMFVGCELVDKDNTPPQPQACTNHTEKWVIDQPATCTETGIKHSECQTCGKLLSVVSISSLGHDDVAGKCVLCGYILGTDGLKYKLIKNNTEYAVSGYTGTSKEVYIPNYYKCNPVTTINVDAFEGSTSLVEKIILPETLKNISCYIHLPYDITDNSIFNCENLQFNEENGYKYLGSDTNPYMCLMGVNSTEITTANNINENCKIICRAFYFCNSLTSVTIPDSVMYFGYAAFGGCVSLTNITIPSSVELIGNAAFAGCISLSNIIIPDSVKTIGAIAFGSCNSLTSVVIGDSVESVGGWAFYDCDSLTIYCEASSQPSGWDSYWNYSNRPVVWGYTGN